MSQNGLSKVESIVDEIVKNNTMFNLKSRIEQENEKESIVKSINSVLSPLNSIGKELVLQDLSVDPDEKFKGFIDSVGNVDIPGLIKITNNVMEEKIELAEREGINLLSNNQAIINKDKEIAESTFALITIAIMVENYEELSIEERESFLNRWDELTEEQQQAIVKKTDKEMKDISKKVEFIADKDKRKKVEDNIKKYEENKNELERLERYQKLIKLKKQGKLSEEENKEYEELAKELGSYDDEQLESKISSLRKGQVKIGNDTRSIVLAYIRKTQLDHANPNYIDDSISKESEKKIPQDVEELKSKLEEDAQNDKSDENEEKSPEERCALSGNAKKQQKYTETKLDMQSLIVDKSEFKFGESYEVDEFEDLGALEDDPPTHQTEISAKLKTPVDTDLVQKELSAVAFATAKANASPEAIREGMQAYKDIISGLSLDELQGKSDDEVLKILQQKSAELRLRGDVGEILGIMSQIGFKSQDGQEPQIATLLTEYRDEFVGMIEEASKEENIERAQNDAKNHALISDVEAQYGLEALQVDLEVAEIKISTDKTLDSWGEKPSEVEEIGNNASDTDTGAVAGSTSSGKPMMQSILIYLKESKGITSSELQEQTDLLGKLAEEQNKDVTREGDEQEEYTTG